MVLDRHQPRVNPDFAARHDLGVLCGNRLAGLENPADGSRMVLGDLRGKKLPLGLADQRGGFLAELSRTGLVDVEHTAFAIAHVNHVRRPFRKGPVTLLALTQREFALLALGDVNGDAANTGRLSGAEDGHRVKQNGEGLAILAGGRIFVRGLVALKPPVHTFTHLLPLLRDDDVETGHGSNFACRVTPARQRALVDKGQASFEVYLENRLRHHLRELPETRFAFLQCRFGFVPFGDVQQDALEVCDDALGIANRARVILDPPYTAGLGDQPVFLHELVHTLAHVLGDVLLQPRHILGVRNCHPRRAARQKIVRGVFQHPLHVARNEFNRPPLRHPPDEDHRGAAVDRGFQVFEVGQCRLQRFSGAPALRFGPGFLRDVLDHAVHPVYPAGCIEMRFCGKRSNDGCTVRLLKAKHVLADRAAFRELLDQPGPALRVLVEGGHPKAHELFRPPETQYPRMRGVGLEDPAVRRGAKHPYGKVFQKRPVLLFPFPQRGLRLLQIGDVADYAYDHRFARGAAVERLFGYDDVCLAIRGRDLFLVDVVPAGGENLLILLPEHLHLFPREERLVRLPENIVPRIACQPAFRLVDQEHPVLAVLDEDRVRNGINDVVKEVARCGCILFGFPKRGDVATDGLVLPHHAQVVEERAVGPLNPPDAAVRVLHLVLVHPGGLRGSQRGKVRGDCLQLRLRHEAAKIGADQLVPRPVVESATRVVHEREPVIRRETGNQLGLQVDDLAMQRVTLAQRIVVPAMQQRPADRRGQGEQDMLLLFRPDAFLRVRFDLHEPPAPAADHDRHRHEGADALGNEKRAFSFGQRGRNACDDMPG
ncbi:MAG: hypothetical protein BWY59_01754 [Verrucomicrobia bacterium ADurb.Bin345]|nr:MAG: hypothetical protein BWY59_01754 [Verrucomicrobia bacterium ADurb.Bin345]